MYTEEQIKKVLKEINWDTTLTVDELYQIFTGKAERIKGVTLRHIYAKLLKHLYFHELYKMLGDDRLREALTDEVIRGVFPQGYRNKLYNVKRLLYP